MKKSIDEIQAAKFITGLEMIRVLDGMSKKEFAESIGLNTSQYSRYVQDRGRKRITKRAMEPVESAVGMEMNQIIEIAEYIDNKVPTRQN